MDVATKEERPAVDWQVTKAELSEQLKAAYLYDEEQRIVDALFAVARDNGWCDETVKALAVVFPNGSPWSDGKWRTTEGYDCLGFGLDGYNREGFDNRGYDRKGIRSGEGYWCTLCQKYEDRG